MRTHRPGGNTVALSVVLSLVIAPGGTLAPLARLDAAQAAAPAAATASGAPADLDGGWPRQYAAANGAQVIVYQPQVSAWENQRLMTMLAAVSYTPTATNTPMLGTITAEADTRVSVAERLVNFSSFRVTQSNFPNASREQAAEAVATLRESFSPRERVIALDRVLAAVDSSRIRPNNMEGVKAEPPVIFYSTRPALVVNLDGEPVWSPLRDNDLRFAVNTNWDLFEHAPSKLFYLRDGGAWLQASAVNGPWTAAATLPPSFGRLPADDNWNEVRAALPGKPFAAGAVPNVFVSTRPAELILLRGQPQYQPVPGTGLQWIRNTDSDLFRVGTTGAIYYLVAGRWFSAPAFSGPWTFATEKLPADFAKIPLEHERSRVLASVPGTPQAAEAVLLAQVPQTARVNKKELKAPEVAYQGAPQFQPIEQTNLARAVNTDKDIIKVGSVYYMCFQGVWFRSDNPQGPWEVTASVPPQIYEIPISSPSHNVTYVTVEDDDDDWVVYATAAAYGGMMVAWGCAVWGSGWYYPPYIGYGGFYPVYYPFYPTYGYSAWYNPWTGTYGRGAAVYGPYGGAGVGARYNPRTGTYARGAAAYGPYGARGFAEAYNPRTGTYARTRQGAGVYGSWGSTAVQRGDSWAATARRTSNITGNTTRVTRGSEGGAAISRRGGQSSGFVGETGSGDVYAGRDGNVYRKQGDSWQKFENGSWNGVSPTPSPRDQSSGAGTRAQDRVDPGTMGQLDRDSAARSDGAQRTRDASSVRSGSSGADRSGSYKPSSPPPSAPRSTGGARPGGGMRTGGGRRR